MSCSKSFIVVEEFCEKLLNATAAICAIEEKLFCSNDMRTDGYRLNVGKIIILKGFNCTLLAVFGFAVVGYSHY